MTLWLLTLWAQIAQRVVGWTLGNNPDRDRDHVNAVVDTLTAERGLRDQAQATRAGAQDVALILKRTIKLVRGDYDTIT